MKRLFCILPLLAVLFTACNFEPEKVNVSFLFVGIDEPMEIKIIYDDPKLPVQKFIINDYDSVDIYNSRKFTIKIKKQYESSYSVIYVDDFSKDETVWFVYDKTTLQKEYRITRS